MSTSAPLDPQTPGNAPASEAPVAPNFEETLRKFWQKNSKVIYLACATAFVVIIAKGGLEYFRAQKQKDIAAAYAAASTSERLKSFASQYPDHALGGAATLRLADEAYSSGKYTEAVAGYQKAASVFKTGPFGSRAMLGAAVSSVLAGQATDGESKLKQLADDAKQIKVVRAEAAYHLAILAADAGRTDDAIKYFDLVGTLDPMGIWSRRAMMHRAYLPVSAPSSLLPVSTTP